MEIKEAIAVSFLFFLFRPYFCCRCHRQNVAAARARFLSTRSWGNKKKANNARASCPCRALGCCLARWGWRNGSLSGDRASRGRWGALHVSWFHGLGHVLRRICLRFVLYCIVCTAIQYVTYRITDRKAVVHRPSYQSRHPPILQKGRNGETTIHSAPHRDGPTWHSTAARSSRDIGSATATIAAHPRGHPPHRESDVASRAATGSSRGPPVLEAAG